MIRRDRVVDARASAGPVVAAASALRARAGAPCFCQMRRRTAPSRGQLRQICQTLPDGMLPFLYVFEVRRSFGGSIENRSLSRVRF